MTTETVNKTEVYICDNCGRDFTAGPGDDPVGPDGVTWCPVCKPTY